MRIRCGKKHAFRDDRPKRKADVNVITLVGERGREVRDFIEKDLKEEALKIRIGDRYLRPPALVRVRAAMIGPHCGILSR